MKKIISFLVIFVCMMYVNSYAKVYNSYNEAYAEINNVEAELKMIVKVEKNDNENFHYTDFIKTSEIDWGDGTVLSTSDYNAFSHVYQTAGYYIVTIKSSLGELLITTFDEIPYIEISNSELEMIHLDSAKINSIIFKNCKKLNRIILQNNNINTIDISSCDKVGLLALNGNPLKTVYAASNSKVKIECDNQDFEIIYTNLDIEKSDSYNQSSVFSDMSSNHWAYDIVLSMKERGIISGFTDGTFRPEEFVTREQFASILSNGLKLSGTSGIRYEDVTDNFWSKEYIAKASKYIAGYLIDGKYYFEPTADMLREDVAVSIVKAKGLENSIANMNILMGFSDYLKITEGKRKYVAIAIENKLMSGNANGTFNPRGGLTRAEVSAVMGNCLKEPEFDPYKEREYTILIKCNEEEFYKLKEWHEKEQSVQTRGGYYNSSGNGEYINEIRGTLRASYEGINPLIEFLESNQYKYYCKAFDEYELSFVWEVTSDKLTKSLTVMTDGEYKIDWGDGIKAIGIGEYLGGDHYEQEPWRGNDVHTYLAPGIYTVTLTGDVAALNCSNSNVLDLNLSDVPMLGSLECSNNKIKELNLIDNVNLGTLSCDHNEINYLNLDRCWELSNLNCSFNKIETLDLSNNTDIRYLDCNDNLLKILDFPTSAPLTNFDCSNNLLVELELPIGIVWPENRILQNLYCSNNQLKKLDISNCTVLRRLNCSNNQLEILDVSDCVKLYELNCRNNLLTSIDVSKNLNLGKLLCSQSTLKEVLKSETQKFDCDSSVLSN